MFLYKERNGVMTLNPPERLTIYVLEYQPL